MNYLTLEEAQEIADDRLNVDAWDEAVIADGSNAGFAGSTTYKAIAMATKAIDRLSYRGDKTDADQVNQFPRGLDDAVPSDVQVACFEIALALLEGIDPQLEAESLGMISQGYANVRSTYDRTIAVPHMSAGIPSLTAWRYLVPYLRDPYFIDVMKT